jgi:hypothetical protein
LECKRILVIVLFQLVSGITLFKIHFANSVYFPRRLTDHLFVLLQCIPHFIFFISLIISFYSIHNLAVLLLRSLRAMAMQLRSGRRLGSPLPIRRGDLRRVRPRRSRDGGDNDGKDWISSLPKDMRLEVLARLQCTREAVRTSVLSEPWRRLWTELRELSFDDVADLDSVLSALAQVQPKLNRLCIEVPGMVLGGASISSLLHAADKLEPLELVVKLCREHHSAPFVLPCFARTTSIELCISCLQFKLPPTGSFASLEQLTLFGAGFIDPGVLLPRCPRQLARRAHVAPGRHQTAGGCPCHGPQPQVFYVLVFLEEVHPITVSTQAEGVVLRVLP